MIGASICEGGKSRRSPGPGGGARIIKFYGGSFSMSAIFILYVRVIFFVCGFFLLRMVRYAWSGGGGGGNFVVAPLP